MFGRGYGSYYRGGYPQQQMYYPQQYQPPQYQTNNGSFYGNSYKATSTPAVTAAATTTTTTVTTKQVDAKPADVASKKKASGDKSDKDLSGKKCKPCEGGVPPLTMKEVEELQGKIPGDWVVRPDGKRIRRKVTMKNFVAAVTFIHDKAMPVAEEEGHHPDVHVEEYKNMIIELWTHAIGGLSENDFILAAKLEDLLHDDEGVDDLHPKVDEGEVASVTANAKGTAATSSAGIIVYTRVGCHVCQRLKNDLAARGIPFQERYINPSNPYDAGSAEMWRRIDRLGLRQRFARGIDVPAPFVNDKYMTPNEVRRMYGIRMV